MLIFNMIPIKFMFKNQVQSLQTTPTLDCSCESYAVRSVSFQIIYIIRACRKFVCNTIKISVSTYRLLRTSNKLL